MMFSVSPEVLGLLSQRREDPRMRFPLDGDLRQMGSQAAFLRAQGYTVLVSGGIPGLATENEHKAAVTLLWANKHEGWWNYQHYLVQYGICTPEEYLRVLRGEP